MTHRSSRNAEVLVTSVETFWRNCGNRPGFVETAARTVSRKQGAPRSGGRRRGQASLHNRLREPNQE